MKCPSCSHDIGDLVVVARGLVGVHRCGNCAGCWIPQTELDKVQVGIWHSVEEMGVRSVEALSSRICPQCATQCAEVSPEDHPEVHIDRCPSCHGLWLDRGELDTLYEAAVEHAEAHGRLESRPDGWSLIRWLSYRLAEDWERTGRVSPS